MYLLIKGIHSLIIKQKHSFFYYHFIISKYLNVSIYLRYHFKFSTICLQDVPLEDFVVKIFKDIMAYVSKGFKNLISFLDVEPVVDVKSDVNQISIFAESYMPSATCVNKQCNGKYFFVSSAIYNFENKIYVKHDS